MEKVAKIITIIILIIVSIAIGILFIILFKDVITGESTIEQEGNGINHTANNDKNLEYKEVLEGAVGEFLTPVDSATINDAVDYRVKDISDIRVGENKKEFYFKVKYDVKRIVDQTLVNDELENEEEWFYDVVGYAYAIDDIQSIKVLAISDIPFTLP